jgi:hypothetical protein
MATSLPANPLNLTEEQRRKLGRAYRLIMSWPVASQSNPDGPMKSVTSSLTTTSADPISDTTLQTQSDKE